MLSVTQLVLFVKEIISAFGSVSWRCSRGQQ